MQRIINNYTDYIYIYIYINKLFWNTKNDFELLGLYIYIYIYIYMNYLEIQILIKNYIEYTHTYNI